MGLRPLKTNGIFPYFSLSQSDKYGGHTVIRDAADFLAAHGIKTWMDLKDDVGRITGGGRRNYRTLRIQTCAYANVIKLLRHLIPHLRVRKITAEDLFRFLLIYPPRTGPSAKNYTLGYIRWIKRSKSKRRRVREEALTHLKSAT